MNILLLIPCVWIVWCGTLLAEVKVGSSKEDVLSEWGQPSVRKVSAGKEILMYVDGREARIQGGKVVEVLGASIQAKSVTTTTTPPRRQATRTSTRTTSKKATTTTTERMDTTVAPPEPPVEAVQAEPEVVNPPVSTPAQPATPAESSAVKALVRQLSGSDSKVKWQAARELLGIGKPAVNDLFESCTDSNATYEAQGIAVDLIDQIIGPASADMFIPMLTNKNWGPIQKAVIALVPRKDPRSVEPFLRVLETADYAPELRRHICIGLGELGDPRALNMLMSRFKLEPDEIVQVEMANAMDKITGQTHYYDVKTRLEWLEKNHPDWLTAGPASFRTPDKSYVKISVMFAAGACVGLFLLYRFWKNR